jgi:uncharacterized protein (TIGR03086 family)
MTGTPIDQLSVALAATGQLIARVSDEQWSAPTGCTKWNVHDLVNHVVVGNYRFASILAGATPSGPGDETPPGSDLLAAYRDSADCLLTAFTRPGVLEESFVVPLGPVPGIVALHLRLTEALVHGWDLARATGQPTAFPEDLVEQELTFSRAKLGDIPPDRLPFAPPQPVADDAPAIDRLCACLGRNVTSPSPG